MVGTLMQFFESLSEIQLSRLGMVTRNAANDHLSAFCIQDPIPRLGEPVTQTEVNDAMLDESGVSTQELDYNSLEKLVRDIQQDQIQYRESWLHYDSKLEAVENSRKKLKPRLTSSRKQ